MQMKLLNQVRGVMLMDWMRNTQIRKYLGIELIQEWV